MTTPKSLPKISIVTPSFNQSQFLEATIQSVLSQNYPNLEYIIIDGGSTDGSLEIIKKYQDYLTFWCSEPDGGQYDAINKGFEQASGEIMAWLNSDDMYYPWAFKVVSSIMAELPEVEWITTLNLGYWDYLGVNIGFTSMPGYSREAFLDGRYFPFGKGAIGWIQQESTFWRRSLWQKIGAYLRTEYRLAGDFDLWSRFISYADLYGVTSALGGFRHQDNQRSLKARQEYISEAHKSLAEVRDFYNWSPDYLRRFVSLIKVDQLPKVRTLLSSTYAYVGRRVIRKNPESPQAHWQIEKYKFYKKFLSSL